MALLTTYEDFIERVEALGFLALSQIIPGLPSLGDDTPESAWHTGLESDPWVWKDRAAEEKRLAYGCILGGHKGFVARRMYPIFYAAFRPTLSMPERWNGGMISQRIWQLWQLFEEQGRLNISQVRQVLGVSRKQGAHAVDTALRQLQREYYLTVDGSERKRNVRGEAYGWPVNRYCRVVDWAPPGWLDGAEDWGPEEARALILDDGVAMSQGINRPDLARKLGWS